MKKLILLSLVMLMTVFAFADNFTIGNGTSTQSNIPFYGYYDYGWSKIVYTPAELSTAGLTASAGITGIGFYVGNSPVSYVAVDQRVYLRHTAATFYDTADNTLPDNTLFTNVYQGNLTYNGGGWHYVTFTAPFVWDGTSSIEIVWENWDGVYGSGYPTFRYTSTSPDYRAVYKYADDTFPGALAGTRYYSRPNIQFVTPSSTPPNAVTLNAPADLAVNQSVTPTLSWTPASTGAATDSYLVYLDTNADPGTLVASPTVPTVTVTEPLSYNTTYYWKVIAHNANGDSPASNVFSFTTRQDPTISSFPWTVNFGTASADWPVANWTQLTGFISGTPTAGGSLWGQDDWLNVSGTNKAAKINIYGTTRNGWLVTPPINVPVETHELRFDAALLDWNDTIAPAGTQPDDRFLVVMSDSPLMTNPTILREWNNTGSPYVFDSISAAGSNLSIPLTGISGIKYFAFYGESTESNGDNDFMIDNVVIQAVPLNPVFAITPAVHDFGSVAVGTTVHQVFTLSNAGAGELVISSISLSNAVPNYALDDSNVYPLTLTGTPVTVTVVYHPSGAGTHLTTLTIVDNLAKANHDVMISGTGIDYNYGGGDASTTAGGYYFANNISFDAPSSPSYSWVNETTNSVTDVTDQDDTVWGPFPIGFAFNYYGVNYSDVYVSSNGFISFTSDSSYWSNQSIPLADSPNNLIALFWDDLEYFAGTSNLYYGGNGSTFTITFDHFGRTGTSYDPLTSVTAQAILYADGRIKLQYNDITGSLTSDHTATIGIENADGSKGIQYNKDGVGGPIAAGFKAGGIAIMFGSSNMTLPVELSSFTAAPTAENYVNLTWITESETNLLGYRVYRNDSDNFSQSSLLTPVMLEATNSSTQHKYDFTDREVEIEQVYYYWLESVDYSSTTVHGPVMVTVLGNESPNIPSVTMMRAAYPNPFKANTTIALDVKAGETATVTIYNLAGQAVRSYKATQGSHTINWDGRDSKNQSCASGVYFYRLTSPSRNITKKMVMVK